MECSWGYMSNEERHASVTGCSFPEFNKRAAAFFSDYKIVNHIHNYFNLSSKILKGTISSFSYFLILNLAVVF